MWVKRFFQAEAAELSDLRSNFWQDFTGQTNCVGRGESVRSDIGLIYFFQYDDKNSR